MDDAVVDGFPRSWVDVTGETAAIGFTRASETRTGAMLATLAASNPGGRMLEVGTGTGVATSWQAVRR
ncbi:MAG: hypothetical protein ABI634_04240 [Acidobacteriota bacterium]